MIIQCPDCSRRLRPKPPEGTPVGAKVGVKCPCGTPLRFTMPGHPSVGPAQHKPGFDFASYVDSLKKAGGL